MTRNQYWDNMGAAERRRVRGQDRIRTSHGGNGGAAARWRSAVGPEWYAPAWARESIRRGLYPCLAGPKGRLP